MSLNLDHVLKLVPDFDGSTNLLHKYINVCEIFYNPLTKENDKTLFLQIVQSKLSGRAYEITQYKTIETWQQLKKELITQFEDSRSVEQLQIELIKLFQGANEDVRTFAHKVEQTLTALNSSCIRREGEESKDVIRNLNEATALRSFQDGLNHSISTIVKACRFTTLKHAVDKAIEEEMSFLSKPRPQLAPNLNRNYLKCQLCFKPGHSAKNCFQYNKPSTSYTSNSSNYQQPSTGVVKPTSKDFRNNTNSIRCLYCKNLGHMLKDCRKRIYNNQRRENTNQPVTNNVHVAENSIELAQAKQNTVVRVQDL